jgi:hypothetical protein
MEQERRWYVIGIGAVEDFDEGRGALLLEERGDEIGLPVFMTPELLERYTDALMDEPDEDPETVEELRAGRYRVVDLDGTRELAYTLAWSTADYIVWNPASAGENGDGIYRPPPSPEEAQRRLSEEPE